jgi:hypothetical protein
VKTGRDRSRSGEHKPEIVNDRHRRGPRGRNLDSSDVGRDRDAGKIETRDLDR